jgi:hypothetical protein
MYTVHSGCLFFDSLSAIENNPSPVLLWNGYAPPKVDVFLWLLLNGSLSTRSFLAERRIIIMRNLTAYSAARKLEQ